MYRNKRILAVITAKGNSKGLPGKNIKSFCGKPLIYWIIKKLKKSAFTDRIIVSTDSPKVASIARKYKAEVPFLRPKKLAGDSTPSIDVILHAIDFLARKGDKFDIIVLLQPTSPLIESADIDGAIKTLFDIQAKVIVSVCEAMFNPLWMNKLPKNGSMKGFLSKGTSKKIRQKLPKYYQVNGAVKLGHINYIKKYKNFYTNKTYAYIMPKERSLDIDDILDFRLAEALFKNIRKPKG